MSFKECMNLIIELSFSQGFYGRLLRAINELSEEEKEELKQEWESKKFATNIDFIEYLEG